VVLKKVGQGGGRGSLVRSKGLIGFMGPVVVTIRVVATLSGKSPRVERSGACRKQRHTSNGKENDREHVFFSPKTKRL